MVSATRAQVRTGYTKSAHMSRIGRAQVLYDQRNVASSYIEVRDVVDGPTKNNKGNDNSDGLSLHHLAMKPPHVEHGGVLIDVHGRAQTGGKLK